MGWGSRFPVIGHCPGTTADRVTLALKNQFGTGLKAGCMDEIVRNTGIAVDG